jgi:peptidoglycan hydrolase-like protein with peptidoglycan-binding domain
VPNHHSHRRRGLALAILGVSLGGLALAQTVGVSPAYAQTESTSTVAPSSSDSTTGSTTSAVPPTSAVPTTSGTTVPPSSVVPSSAPATTMPATTGVPSTISGSTIPGSTVPGSTVPGATSVPAPPTTRFPGQIIIPQGKEMKVGSKGDAVLALEKRLAELKIDTGKVDGKFDWSTWQGVVGFQKYWGLKRTGKVDNALRLKIQESAPIVGLITKGGGTRVEVDKSRQIAMIYQNGTLFRLVAVSTGSGKKYCDYSKKAKTTICGTSNTPTGKFKIQRRINGWRESNLGRLYNPLYFNGGIAFHGAPSVPVYPASHGCVRLPMPVAEWFPDEVDNGTPVYVYD